MSYLLCELLWAEINFWSVFYTHCLVVLKWHTGPTLSICSSVHLLVCPSVYLTVCPLMESCLLHIFSCIWQVHLTFTRHIIHDVMVCCAFHFAWDAQIWIICRCLTFPMLLITLGGTARWLQLQPSSSWPRRRKRSKMFSLCTTRITARSSWDSYRF